jgi:hypothetical protein
VLWHYLERVSLSNSCQGEVHFQEGERLANTSSRPFAKGEVGTPVPPGFLHRRKTFWLKLLGLGPKPRMPVGDVWTDHHDGILWDCIAANLI